MEAVAKYARYCSKLGAFHEQITRQFSHPPNHLQRTPGEIEVQVQYTGQKKKLNLLVAGGNGPSLLGRDWLSYITLD